MLSNLYVPRYRQRHLDNREKADKLAGSAGEKDQEGAGRKSLLVLCVLPF
jgi:hypothetical protein